MDFLRSEKKLSKLANILSVESATCHLTKEVHTVYSKAFVLSTGLKLFLLYVCFLYFNIKVGGLQLFVPSPAPYAQLAIG